MISRRHVSPTTSVLTAVLIPGVLVGLCGCNAPDAAASSGVELGKSSLALHAQPARGEAAAHADAVERANRAFCPAGSGAAALDLHGVQLERVAGIPLQYEGFNNIEGPLWHEGALYYTNMGNRIQADGSQLTNQTTLWRWEPGKAPEVWLDDTVAGTNGLAVNFDGELIAARQLDGSVSQIDWVTKQIRTLAGIYEDRRFNSPNDLSIAHDGTIYFTDPNWNVPSSVDAQTIQGGGDPGSLLPGQRAYRLGTDGIVWPLVATELVPELRDKPNGIQLSLDEGELLVGGLRGLWAFELREGQVKHPVQVLTTAVDGMGKDCAGNVYVATSRPVPGRDNGQVVVVLDRHHVELGQLEVPGIQGVTNVAFGGNDRRTLFVTGLTNPQNDDGSAPRLCGSTPCLPAGIYSAQLNVPGFPY